MNRIQLKKMKSKVTFTQAEADEIVLLIETKLKADPSKQKGIRAKIRNRGFWASEFGFRDGYTVADFLSSIKIVSKGKEANEITVIKVKATSAPVQIKTSPARSSSDESYIIELCDEVLKSIGLRQHRFDFLKGDSGSSLPVDAYYPSLNVVVEFKERQHTEAVKFFDKRQTVSGVDRGEQRKIYDRRRQEILPKQGIILIEFDYSDFEHTRGNKLVRNIEEDLKVIKRKLKNFK